ncbi:hypothetical protein PVAG01_04240 [Phlyctema vagabunda]|uniref:Endosomal spry domain-containing protein n=1 Tax=Phlyctema vagabunda TaxID=108571 RepID=A0ABR4PNS6_9HELO
MAPLPDGSPFSSITNLVKRTISSDISKSIIKRTNAILPRSGDLKVDPASGVTPPDSINNTAVFVIFGLIGASFVCIGIWFFFRAKNGGFYFHENDWDDYKSTVLRRKGPNGTTLSGATESTDLGGGSVVHGEKRWRRKHKGGKSRYTDYEDDNGSSVTGSSEMSELKSRYEKESRKSKGRHGGLRGGDLDDEEMDIGVQDAVRAYRHEKPARVGGINKQSDGSNWEGSTQESHSDLLSNRERTPTSTPTKSKKERKDNYTGGSGGGIRKVMPSTKANSTASFWSRGASSHASAPSTTGTEDERIKAEAKKLQDKGRAAQRRDFSFQTGDDSTVADEAEERRARREERREKRRAERAALAANAPPGNYAESSVGGSEVSGDTGTKSYHHVIPGLSSGGVVSEYTEDRRKKRNGGYRRGGTGSDDE